MHMCEHTCMHTLHTCYIHTPLPQIIWKTTEEDTRHQLLASTHMYIHMRMYVHTLVPTHVHTKICCDLWEGLL